MFTTQQCFQRNSKMKNSANETEKVRWGWGGGGGGVGGSVDAATQHRVKADECSGVCQRLLMKHILSQSVSGECCSAYV